MKKRMNERKSECAWELFPCLHLTFRTSFLMCARLESWLQLFIPFPIPLPGLKINL